MIRRKLTALFLCAAMLLATVAFAPFAFAATEADDASSQLELMKTLGVFPADIAAGAPLTRIELAKIYFRIFNPDLAEEEYVGISNNFSDLGDEHFAANFAAQMGIMSGSGDGTFNPEGTLTYNELVKTLVCFLGYQKTAEAKGGWPIGYTICGNDFGFGKYADSDNIVSTDVAAALFTIAADVEVMELDIISDDYTTLKKSGKNYLEKYLDIYFEEGVVSANYLDNMYKADSSEKYHRIKLGTREMCLNSNTLTLRRYMGYYAKVFARQASEGDIPEILYYEITENDDFVIDETNIADYDHSARKISYYNEKGRKKSFDIRGAYVIYNNSLCTSYDENVINPFLEPTLDGKITLIDNDKDGKIDVVSVRAYKTYVISKIVDGKLYNKYHPSDIFDIKDFTDGDYAITNILGETIPVSALDDGNIISVLKDRKGNIKEIIASMDYYVGYASEIKADTGSYDGVVVDNKYFEFAARYRTEYNAEPTFKPGDKIKMFFDFEGLVCDVEAEAYDTFKTGYLIDMAPASNTLKGDINVRLLNNTGKIIITKLRDKIEFNGSKKNAEDVPALLGYAESGTDIKRQVIKYEYDEEANIITSIISVDDTIDQTQDGFYQFKDLDDDTFSNYRTGTSGFNAKLLLNGKTLVFVVPNEDNRQTMKYYDVYGTDFFEDNKNYKTNYSILAYGSKAYHPVAEALVVEPNTGMGAVGAIAKSKVMVITAVNEVYEDGNTVYGFDGYVSGKAVSYKCKDAENFFVADGNKAPDIGDVIYFGTDKAGDIAAVDYIFDASERKMASTITANPSDTNLFAEPRYCVAGVQYYKDDIMTIEIESYIDGEESKIEHYPVSGTAVYEYDSTGRETVLTVSDSASLHDERNNNYPATVFLSTFRSVPQFIIVYHN